jgi:hypothetical protein
MKAGPNINYRFFSSIIIDASKYMLWLVKDRITKFSNSLCNIEIINSVEYIIILSFIHVLSKKKNYYKKLLIELNIIIKNMNKNNKTFIIQKSQMLDVIHGITY